MIDSIILQAEKAYGITLLGMLSMEYPKLNIILVNDLSELIAIPISTLKRSRLISFSSSNIVPAKILGLLGYGAYNFHPGPPSRPGWGAIEKAIYDQDQAFGTTLHLMNEYVDAGPIIAINLFPIPAGCNRKTLSDLAFQNLLNLFTQHLKELVESTHDLIELPIEWGHKKFTRSDYSAYCIITEDIDRSELDLRIRAFQAPFRPAIRFQKDGTVYVLANQEEEYSPTLKSHKLHGHSFIESS